MSQFSSEAQSKATESQARSPLGEGWERLKLDLNKLRSDLAEVAQSLVEASKAQAGDARTHLQTMAQQRLEQIRSALESARGQGKTAADTLERQIEEHPLTSVLVAFGAGLVLGSLMSRR